MIEIGITQSLTIDRLTAPGAFLTDGEGSDVLLPNKYLDKKHEKGQKVEVFVYKDSEDRPVATTETPLVGRNQFACLKVVDVSRFGAFMDWGLEKDLLVPFKQQASRMNKGEWYIIYMYLDESTQRLVATSKLYPHFEKDLSGLEVDQEVQLLLGDEHDLGIQVIVNEKYNGLIFHSEIHQDVMMGDQVKGFIKNIRTDGKLDITLQKTGLEHMEAGAAKILEVLIEEEGFIEVTDKSSPEDIQFYFQLSKKAFKRSLGNLYKKKKVEIRENGIQLIDTKGT
jgi:predicted RNA-binding protein (virulence factor B family)